MSDYRIDYRIAASGGTLIRLIHRGLPNPDRWTFIPYATTYFTSDGESKGDGYPSATWTWELLSQIQLNALLAFFSADTDASVEVDIRTPTERGARVGTTDYTAIMHRPIAGDNKEMIKDSVSPVWTEVTMRFTRLE